MKKYKHSLFDCLVIITAPASEIIFGICTILGVFFSEREKNDKSVLMNMILKQLSIKETVCHEGTRSL